MDKRHLFGTEHFYGNLNLTNGLSAYNIAVFFTFQTLSIKYLVNKNYYNIIQSDDLPPSTTGVEGIAEHFFFLLLTQEYKTAW